MGLLDFITNPISSLVGGLANAGASAAGAASQLKGQEETNAANERINSANIAWQTDMSNTAVQRRAADMTAAGINPILAAGSPASQPSASMIPMQNPRGGMGQAGQAVGAALAGLQPAVQAARLNSAQAANLEANADLTRSKIKEQDITSSNAAVRQNVEIENLRKNVEERIQNFELTEEQRRQIHTMIPFLVDQAKASIAKTEQDTSSSKTAQQLDKYKLPSAAAEAKVWEQIGAAGRGANIGANALQQAITIIRMMLNK